MRRTSGLPLLILIFVSLCLITFSLLSVSESRADQTLGEKMAARTTTYYEANTKANQLLSKVDAQLANYLRQFSSDASSTPESSYYDSCRQIADVIPEVSWDTDTHTVSFAIAITESQQLAVVLAVKFPKKDTDTLYHITTWKIVNTQDWAADTSMKLLRTDTPESET